MQTLSRGALAAAAALTTTVVVAGMPSQAHAAAPYEPAVKVTPIDTASVLPLSFAVDRGTVFVADAATSTIRVAGQAKPVVTGPQPGEIAGIERLRSGAYAYAATDGKTGRATLTIRVPGRRTVVADLSAFERKYNPDAKARYGVTNPSRCVRDAWAKNPNLPPLQSRGIVESHPYAVAFDRKLGWIVADAAGNDLLRVDSRGRVRLLSVLPRQPFRITAAAAKELGLPTCAIGVVYNFEAVPTDVERGPDGKLYVTTLPGGPEGGGPGLSGRGSVYRVHPHTGRASRIGTGFTLATGLAVTRWGQVLVAEYGPTGRISVLHHRRPRPLVTLPWAAAVEVEGYHLYASTAPLGEQGPTGGTVVKIHP